MDTEIKAKRSVRRLASGPQLYVLNRAGWLALRDSADPDKVVTNQAADDAIQRSMKEATQ